MVPTVNQRMGHDLLHCPQHPHWAEPFPIGDGNVLIITIFEVFTEYAAGSFSQTQISKLRSNNQCNNTENLTQVKGHLDGSGGIYLKVAGSRKQQHDGPASKQRSAVEKTVVRPPHNR